MLDQGEGEAPARVEMDHAVNFEATTPHMSLRIAPLAANP